KPREVLTRSRLRVGRGFLRPISRRQSDFAWSMTNRETKETAGRLMPIGLLISLTLKALANFSPGLRFGNPGEQPPISRRRNSEGVASLFAYRNAVATPSELRRTSW